MNREKRARALGGHGPPNLPMGEESTSLLPHLRLLAPLVLRGSTESERKNLLPPKQLATCTRSASQARAREWSSAKSPLVTEPHCHSHAKCADEHCRRHHNAQAKPGGHRRVSVCISCWCRSWCRTYSGGRHEIRHAHIEDPCDGQRNRLSNQWLKCCLGEACIHTSQSHGATHTACCTAGRTHERSRRGCQRGGSGCGGFGLIV